MTTALRISRDIVALEAFSATTVVGLLKNVFPGIREDFARFTASFSPSSEAIKPTGDQLSFMRLVERHAFLDLAPLKAFVPEGLKVTYLTYAHDLQAAVVHCAALEERVLTPYANFLAGLVNSNDQILSTKRIDQTFPALAKERERLTKALGENFTNGSAKAESKYGQVLSRNADWQQVFRQTEQIARTVNQVDRTVLQKKVTELTQLLDIVTRKIQRGEFEGVSPEVLNNLADGAYQVASELEFYSTTHYRVLALQGALTRTVTLVTATLKELG